MLSGARSRKSRLRLNVRTSHDRQTCVSVPGMRFHIIFCRSNHFFQRRMLTEYAGNVYLKLLESAWKEPSFGTILSGAS